MTLITILRIIIILIFFAIVFGPELINFFKFTKKDLANYYGIGKKLLNKWVINFTSFDKRRWNSINGSAKLSRAEFKDLISQLGNGKVLAKDEICEILVTHYKRSANYFSEFFEDELEISGSIYKSMRKFPPKLSLEIIDGYNREMR